MKLTEKNSLGKTGLQVPAVIYGTSYLGNLYRELSYREKLALMEGWFRCTEVPVVIDTAGKYGAGLALEVIGKGLRELGIDPGEVVISNKLGWYRVPLAGKEPTFEPGAWAGLTNDCMQIFGYHGILDCFEQGGDLLGGDYHAELVSVHDPDEFLAAAENAGERGLRLELILESYRALFDLKKEGRVKAVGIGSKDWTIIRELYVKVPFDWVMLANSFTIHRHPEALLDFLDRLHADGVGIINSAVFHGGFLTGGDRFDYREVDPGTSSGRELLDWRDAFRETCAGFKVEPGDAALHFSLSHPAVVSIALNTSKPEKMDRNVEILQQQVPPGFWEAMKEKKLIDPDYPYV